ncbi:MAG: hypothetical protein WC372_09895, partial [Candidatus Neomarinimicrobiota bacterium]|jgi:hypothetical protein
MQDTNKLPVSNIASSSTSEKLPKTHYEGFLEFSKKAMGLPILELLQKSIKDLGDYVPGTLDDRPFQNVGLMIIKSILKAIKMHPDDYVDKLTITDIYNKLPEILPDFRSYMNLLHHIYLFSRRRMIFRFEEALTAKLLYTDINKVDSEFVRCPFDSFYISIPENREMMIRNQHTGIHRVVGIYVSYIEDIEALNARYPDEEKDEEGWHPDLKFEGKRYNKAIRIFAVADKNENAVHEKDDATFYMTLFFAPGDVFPQVDYMVRKYSDKDQLEKDYQYLWKLFEFTLNAILYITSPTADFVRVPAKYDSSKNKDVAAKKNANLSKIGVISTGSHVYITHEYRMRYRNGTLRDTPQSVVSTGTPMWVVRGHYRNQAHGPGRTLRMLIWIEPHVKGKGIVEGNSPGRTYTVT